MDEAILLKKAKRGDVSAFEALIQLYKNKIYALALRITGNPDDAFDVSQESVLKIYQALPRFKEKSSFSTWVYQITRNTALDFLRKKRKTLSLEELQEQGGLPSISTVDVEERVIRSEKHRALEKAIAELPEQLKAVILLRDVDGYSYEEIAIIIGAALGTVKSRLYRAREMVRNKFREYGENNE